MAAFITNRNAITIVVGAILLVALAGLVAGPPLFETMRFNAFARSVGDKILYLGSQDGKRGIEFAVKVDGGEVIFPLVEKEVRASLRNGPSAEFSGLKVMVVPAQEIVGICGEVNAKNGFGGFAGFQPFVVPLQLGDSLETTKLGVVLYLQDVGKQRLRELCS